MKDIHHLTLQDRQAIQSAIEEGKTKAEIDFYHAARADSKYREELVSCREGINMEETERNLIGETISPLLKQGQSVYQILSNHPELQLSDRTLYRYIETGVFKKFGVDNFSLKEQVSRRQFKEKYKKRKEPANYTGRRYSDYLEFIQQNPDITAVEMDTVYNQQSGPYIQTFMFPGIQFMVGRLHYEKSSESMSSALNHYQNQLGTICFLRFSSLFSPIAAVSLKEPFYSNKMRTESNG